jgi:hypothetical protein
MRYTHKLRVISREKCLGMLIDHTLIGDGLFMVDPKSHHYHGWTKICTLTPHYRHDGSVWYSTKETLFLVKTFIDPKRYDKAFAADEIAPYVRAHECSIEVPR